MKDITSNVPPGEEKVGERMYMPYSEFVEYQAWLNRGRISPPAGGPKKWGEKCKV